MKHNLIKSSVLKISVLCAVCVIVLILCYVKTLEINQKKEKTFDKLNNLSVILSQINLIERDFFEFESKNPDFYTQEISQLNRQYSSLYQELEGTIKSLNNDLLPKQKKSLMHYEQNLASKIDKHKILWDTAEYYIRKRGFKDFGLEGKMRQEIHYIEHNCPLPNLEMVLMLRRHEKDFFLRKQNVYIDKAGEVVRKLTSTVEKLTIDELDKKKYLQALNNYHRYFLFIVSIENKIGTDRNKGLRNQIAQQMLSIEDEISRFKFDLAKHAEHQIFFINCLYVLAILLLIIAIILSITTSKQLDKPIKSLIASIQETINSDFDVNSATFIVQGGGEIANLSLNVRKMFDRIISARNKLYETQIELEDRNFKLTEQSVLVQETLDLLEAKNQHMVSSISYAKKIQEVFLPSDAKLKSLFEKSEVIYQPKDIIGGDFYSVFECEEYKFMIAMDCTGHGVPGAFMTILGATIINRLKRMIQCGDHPSTVMERFDELFVELFCDEEYATKDGMEVAIVSIHKASNQLKFCGSKLHLIVQHQNQISLIKGSKKVIGEQSKKNHVYVDEVLDLEIGDRFYLLSDGLQDQFGGLNFEKLKRKVILKTLEQNKENTLTAQMTAIRTLLLNWMNACGKTTVQTDDVLMLGVEV
jgi:serine phosphatase RsbU (regulator of sigma subunit)